MTSHRTVRIDGAGVLFPVEGVPDGALARLLAAVPIVQPRSGTAFFWLGPVDQGERAGRREVLRVSLQAAELEGWRAELERVDRSDARLLTDRELEVLTLLACGLSNINIALRLEIARRTVATHVELVFAKLGVSTRAAAAALALELSLLTLPVPGLNTRPIGLELELDVLALGAAAAGVPIGLAAPARARRARSRSRPIRIGAVYPRNEEWSGDARLMRAGAELAVQEANDRGGIDGRPLELCTEQVDVGSAVTVAAAVARLLNQEVDAITLGALFDRSRGAFEMQLGEAAMQGVPLLHHSTSAQAAALVAEEPERFGNVFQACSPANRYGEGFLRIIQSLRVPGASGLRSGRILLLESADPDLATSTPALRERLQRAGWEVQAVTVAEGESAWADAAATVRAVDPFAVLLGCYSPRDLAAFMSAYRRDATGAVLYAVYAPSVPSFLSAAGDNAEGLYWATVTGRYPDALGTRFARDFERRFHMDAGLSSAGIHYDMVGLLAQAWSFTRSPAEHSTVSAVLRSVVYRGVNGNYYFGHASQTNRCYPDDGTDPATSQAQLVFQVRGLQHRVVAAG
ncbi:ABC transporter substrate-binding protein [Herbiconiux sp. YIM B11900]|uniref:ABC transporter substrate-binding protein n=1 Tax=Herbiconiux sp. YIM B11900 TaxID=3404131 RepID=UPI003F8329DB